MITHPVTDMVACNNIVDLPSEILCMVLTYLDLRTLFNLRSTCHTFYELCSLAFLYTKLDLQPFWHLLNGEFIELLPSLTDNITALNLSWLKVCNLDVHIQILHNTTIKIETIKNMHTQ